MARIPPTDSSRISLASCRRLIGALASGHSDAELEKLRDELYTVARVALEVHPMGGPRRFASAFSSLAEDQRFDVEERAAILEFDGRLTRDQAERLALAMQCRPKIRQPA